MMMMMAYISTIWVEVYSFVMVYFALLSLSAALRWCAVTCQVLMRASSRLHDWLFSTVMRAPVSFFDLTPRGRIVNRFSRDMDESTNCTARC